MELRGQIHDLVFCKGPKVATGQEARWASEVFQT